MNDIQVLKEMLISSMQVNLQQRQGNNSVDLVDTQSETKVTIKGLPPESVVIRTEDFKVPTSVFTESKSQRKRADFAIMSNKSDNKWIICIEIQAGNKKSNKQVVAQLKGTKCFICYCVCIGKSFWKPTFFKSYKWRYISIVDARGSAKQLTRKHKQTHNTPQRFQKLRGNQHYFNKLIYEA